MNKPFQDRVTELRKEYELVLKSVRTERNNLIKALEERKQKEKELIDRIKTKAIQCEDGEWLVQEIDKLIGNNNEKTK